MNYKAYIYVITLFLSIYSLSGVNFDRFFKTNKALEARIIVLILAVCMSYLLTNFITDFMSLTTIIKG
ncbi:MAG TPA: hypothetical protein DCE23_01050 [Firmicutes bacterium]|nr:hypothetical protein [Bacillota bacterium]